MILSASHWEQDQEQLESSAQNCALDSFLSGFGPLNPNFKVTQRTLEFESG